MQLFLDLNVFPSYESAKITQSRVVASHCFNPNPNPYLFILKKVTNPVLSFSKAPSYLNRYSKTFIIRITTFGLMEDQNPEIWFFPEIWFCYGCHENLDAVRFFKKTCVSY